MGVVTEALHELLGGLMQHGVLRDLRNEIPVLGFVRKLAVQDQIRGLEESAVLSQFLDGVARYWRMPRSPSM